MKQFVIPTIITLLFGLMIVDSPAIANHVEREQLKKECMKNLDAIGKAILTYRDDHNGEMPDWISELYPKYLQDSKILLCPADKTGGSPAVHTAYKDPKMPCSYLYEFNPMKFPQEGGLFEMNPPKNLTYKQRKTIELKYFGDTLPVVRCRHHFNGDYRQILDFDYGGKISISSDYSKSPDDRVSVISFFQSAIERNPDDWEQEISLQEIYKYFKDRQWLPDFRAVLEKQSNLSGDALKILGEIYRSEGNIDEAIKIYNRLIRLTPDDTDLRFQLAKLNAISENYLAAREQCQRILQLKPDSAEVHGLLAELDAIADGRRIQERYSKTPASEMHYLVKLEELLLASKENLKPTVRKASDIAEDSFGKSTTVKKLEHIYQTLDKSFSEAKGQWQTYNSSDGLINNWVFSIVQDERGILWIGTAAGVCQYNGENFTRFTINEEFDNERILAILIDTRGHLWFGSLSHGCMHYDGANFVNYTTENGLSGNFVRDIIQDSDGAIWFACSSGGLSRYADNKFTNFTSKDGLAGNEVYDIMEDSLGLLWIGTNGGVSQYDGKTFTNLTEADGLVEKHVRAISEDEEGNFWFGTDKGASQYDGKIFTSFTKKDGLTDAAIWRILVDSSGNIWFALLGWSREGIFRYNGKTFISFTKQDGLAGNAVNRVFEDREGNIWFGHDSAAGLTKFNPRGLKNYGIEAGLANAATGPIAEDSEGNLWILHRLGVSKLSPDKSRELGHDGMTFTQPLAQLHRVLGNISAVLIDSQNNLWFGTFNDGDNSARGVIRFDGENHTRFTTQDGLVWNQILSLFEDRKGNIWMGSGSGGRGGAGISRYDGSSFTNFTMADGLGYDDVMCLTEDHQGNIWIGTWPGGISRYDGTQFTNFTTDDGLVSNLVKSIFTDSRGRIWIGTGNGLSMYDGASFTTLPQFSGNYIMPIIEDRNGYLWFGTLEDGVIKTDGERLTQMTTNDGLPDNSVGALQEDKDGNIWIGTEKGLAKYTPNSIAPLIHIESVVADKVYTNPNLFSSPNGESRAKLGSDGDNLEISIPAGKNVRINYRGISFRTRPEAMQYLYQLHDVERTVSSLDDWQEPTNKRSVDYLNLKPGTYTFKVKVIDIDLNYSQPASLTLKVMPPFYLMGVFLAPTVSFGTILLATLIILATSLIKRRREVRAYERTAVEELQDANRVQMMLMPDEAPPIEGLQIAGKCLPANTVSGDFFDYLVGKGDNEIGLVVADVCGKAMKGAMNAMMTDGILHSVAKDMEKLSPASLMMGLNDVLKGRLEQYMNVTMVIGVIHRNRVFDKNSVSAENSVSEGEITLTLANAAHHAHPILLRDSEIEVLKTGGLPLGMRAGIQYTEEQFELQSGDVLILMSDGIIEAKAGPRAKRRDSEEKDYSESGRLEETILKFTPEMSVEAMVDAIINDAIDYSGDKTQRDDDMTVVVVKIQ